jgi:hypothetical protein
MVSSGAAEVLIGLLILLLFYIAANKENDKQ